MPKIDWRDEDQPRRQRVRRSEPRRRAPTEPDQRRGVVQPWVALPPPPPPATRRPLHLIWGVPRPRT